MSQKKWTGAARFLCAFVADPLFVDPAGFDFHLLPDAAGAVVAVLDMDEVAVFSRAPSGALTYKGCIDALPAATSRRKARGCGSASSARARALLTTSRGLQASTAVIA